MTGPAFVPLAYLGSRVVPRIVGAVPGRILAAEGALGRILAVEGTVGSSPPAPSP